jgi:hypothetical protein
MRTRPSGAGVAAVARAAPARPAGNALIRGGSADDGSTSGPFGLLSLIETTGPDAAGWRSRTDALPVTLRFSLRDSVVLDRAAFRQTEASPPPFWARDVELLLSATGEDAGWIPVGRWALAQTLAPQEFSYRPTLAKAIQVRVLSRHGSLVEASFTSLGTFAIGRQIQDHSPLLAG